MQAAIRVSELFLAAQLAALRQIGINQPTPMHGVSFSGLEHDKNEISFLGCTT